jgi:two-component system, response regulator YesN
MIKVMIVDDESIILDKLHHIIAWEDYDCTIIAECNDSCEALQSAEELQPDLVFADICMPIMNGIEFSGSLKKKLPQSIVILISGYDDFSYAQQAIATGVFRYLLKPIKSEELLKVLQEAKQYSLLLAQESKEKEELRILIRNSLPSLREKFLGDLVHGELDRKHLQEQLSFLEMNPQSDLFGVAAIQLDDYTNLCGVLNAEDLHLCRFQLLNILQNQLGEVTGFLYGFQNKPGELILIYGLTGQQCLEDIFQGVLEVQNNFRELHQITFSAGLGRLYPEFESLKISYREALLALDFKVWTGKNVLIPYNDIENTRIGHMLCCPEPEYGDFISILREGNIAKAFSFIEQVFNSFKSKDYARTNAPTKSFLHLTLIDLLNQIIRSLLEFNITIEEVFGAGFDPFIAINSHETVYDLEHWLKELTQKAIDHISNHKQDVNKNFVEKAKQYLENHYGDPNLNLALVAENVYVSSCYLSHLFKEVTGNAVIEYLNKIRIRAAKKLLKESQLKIYEIAEQIGFNDYHYFGIVFKKATGLAPLEYRDKVQFDNYI